MNTKPRNFRVIEHIYPDKRVFYGQYQVKLLGVKFWFYLKSPIYYKNDPGERFVMKEETRTEFISFEEAELALRTRFPEVKVHNVRTVDEYRLTEGKEKTNVKPINNSPKPKVEPAPQSRSEVQTSADKLIEDLKGGMH